MRRLAVMTLALGLLPAPAAAADGFVLWSAGDVRLVRNLQDIGTPAAAPLLADDTLRVPIGARVRALVGNASVLQAWDDAEWRLVAGEQGRMDVEHVRGSIRVAAEGPGVVVRAPTARIILAAGDDVIVAYSASGDYTEVLALTGAPVVGHIYEDFPGDVTLQARQTTVVTLDAAPSRPGTTDQGTFARRQAELSWTMPQPVPDGDARFAALLGDLGDATWRKLRLAAGRPVLPAWSVREPMAGETRPIVPGQPLPTPTSGLRVTIVCPNECRPTAGGTDAP
jgi:hypothetical protein